MVYESHISDAEFEEGLRLLATEIRAKSVVKDTSNHLPTLSSTLFPLPTLTLAFSEPIVFTHNPADPDLAEAIRENPGIEKGACHFRVVLLTWHFDSFHIHAVPLQISPLRFRENLKDASSQLLIEPRHNCSAILNRRPALNIHNWKDGEYLPN